MQNPPLPEQPLQTLTGREAAAALSFGVVSLLFVGVLPALLGALGDEHRLSASSFGICASLEALTMGLSTALSGIFIPPRRLRLIGLAATLFLAAVDFAGVGAGEDMILILRTLAGISEGILLWISVGMI